MNQTNGYIYIRNHPSYDVDDACKMGKANNIPAVPYQHFTNSIENYFSMLKSRLQKLDGLTHEKLKENIEKVIKDIPKEKYVKKPSNRTRKLKNYLP